MPVSKQFFWAIVFLILTVGLDSTARSSPYPGTMPDTATSTVPSSYTGRIDSIPDYYQRDASFGALPAGGVVYCGPVAVSNSLIWLSGRGFPSLCDHTGDSRYDQFNLIRLLGSRRYFNTHGEGSGVRDLCRGVKLFLCDRGISGTVRFEGMYATDTEFETGRKVPRLETMKEYTIGSRAAWLNIGWYVFDSNRKTYTKTGGHWVTLVGYGYDGSRENPDCLIIHDPDTRGAKNEYLTIETITEGMLINGAGKEPRNGAGFLRFKISATTYGIIGGVVYLSLGATHPPLA